MYWLRRKITQISRLIDFLPTVWRGYDFDYSPGIQLLAIQLKRQASFMESDKAYTACAKVNAGKIRLFLRLLEKVYGEDNYSSEYWNQLEERFGPGKWVTERVKLDGEEEEYVSFDCVFGDHTAEETSAVRRELFLKGQEKQKKAHRILWKFFEHNVEKWWD